MLAFITSKAVSHAAPPSMYQEYIYCFLFLILESGESHTQLSDTAHESARDLLCFLPATRIVLKWHIIDPTLTVSRTYLPCLFCLAPYVCLTLVPVVCNRGASSPNISGNRCVACAGADPCLLVNSFNFPQGARRDSLGCFHGRSVAEQSTHWR